MAEIEVTREGGVNRVRFNRAEKKNAITRAMYRTLADAVLETDSSDELGATLFLGQPEVFTSGNDLGDFMSVATGGEKGTEVVDFLRAIITSKKPLVAAVDGLAVGIGQSRHRDNLIVGGRDGEPGVPGLVAGRHGDGDPRRDRVLHGGVKSR